MVMIMQHTQEKADLQKMNINTTKIGKVCVQMEINFVLGRMEAICIVV